MPPFLHQADRPFFGICLGLQLLFEGSEENGGIQGLGLIPGKVTRFEPELDLPVPHIGWNDLDIRYLNSAFSDIFLLVGLHTSAFPQNQFDMKIL